MLTYLSSIKFSISPFSWSNTSICSRSNSIISIRYQSYYTVLSVSSVSCIVWTSTGRLSISYLIYCNDTIRYCRRIP